MAVPWRGPRVLINLSSANFKKIMLRIYSLIMFDWSMSPFAFSARREKDIVALNKHSPCSPQVQEGRCWMSGTKLCQGLAGNKVSRIEDRSGHHWFWGCANQITWNTQVCSRPYAAICCCCVYMFMCICIIFVYTGHDDLYTLQKACRVSQLPSVEWGKGVRRMVMATQNLDGNGLQWTQKWSVNASHSEDISDLKPSGFMLVASPLVTAVLSSWSLSCHMFEVQELWSLQMPCHFCCHFSINQVRQINEHCNI